MAIIFPAPTPQEEAEAVKNTERSAHELPHKDGDRLYLISQKWWTEWCQHTGYAFHSEQKTLAPLNNDQHTPGPRPGKITSSDLIVPDAPPGDLTLEELQSVVPLRSNLIEKVDFVCVYPPTYLLLKGWYGVDGPEVSREYVATGPSQRVDFTLAQRHIKAVDDHTRHSVIVAINPQSSIADLKKRCCRALDIEEPQEYNIMSYAGMLNPQTLENVLDKTVVGARIEDRQAILLQRKDAAHLPGSIDVTTTATAALPTLKITNTGAAPMTTMSHPVNLSTSGSFASPLISPILGNLGSPGRYKLGTSPLLSSSPLSRSFGRAPMWAEDVVTKSMSSRPGLAGLGNLGNTCFMNSSLQCLIHTLPLMDTFLTGDYHKDINKDNPLGLGGKLATAFGALMHKVWKPEVSSVSPKHFKWQLGKFAPQFGGYAQQDSQELLSFLLDGLHEDLNRIQVKPYTEDKDADGRPDEEVAAEAWTNYRARNDSVIVDNFQGLLKSTLRCPQCNYQSVKFDPFMYLTLPLPSALTRTLTITVIDINGAAPPTAYAVEVPKNAAVRKVYAGLGELLSGVGGQRPEERLLLGQWTSTGNGSLDLLTDLDAKVSVIRENLPQKRSFFSLSTSSASKLVIVAYLYPKAEVGPMSGGTPVVLHNRAGYSSCLPPLVLFVPGTELSALPLTPSGNYCQVGNQDTVIDGALRAALTPFHTNTSHDDTNKASTSASALAPIGPEPILMGMHNAPSMTDLVASGPSLVSHPLSGAESLPTPPAAVHAMDAEEASSLPGLEDGGMDVDIPDPSTPVRSLANTPSSSEGDLKAMTTEGPGLHEQQQQQTAAATETWVNQGASDMDTSATPAVHAAEGGRHEMQASQQGVVDQQLQQQEGVQPKAEAPYILLIGSANGQPKYMGISAPTPLAPDYNQDAVHLIVEWKKDAIKQYSIDPLEKPEQHESAIKAQQAAAAPKKAVSLENCVEAFCQPEQLDASESWYCSKCKGHVQADKKLDLWRLPDVLVVHLKRFCYSKYSRDKLDTLVDFPLEGLDLSAYVPITEGGTRGTAGSAPPAAPSDKPSLTYDLFAVSNHYGGMGGGHYTAYCRMPDDAHWYTFDDSSVRGMKPGEVHSTAAYVLFYRRRREAGPGQPSEADQLATILQSAAAVDNDLAATSDEMPFGHALHGKTSLGPSLEFVGEGTDAEEGGQAIDINIDLTPLEPAEDPQGGGAAAAANDDVVMDTLTTMEDS